MSIQLTVTPVIRPFRGFAEPALPDGYWVVHQSVLGDASGGLMSINIRFSSAAQPNVSTMWSMEQLLFSATADGSRDVRIDFGNMDIFPVDNSTGARQKVSRGVSNDLGSISGSAINLTTGSASKLFLGAAGKDVNGDLAFDTDNVDATSFSVFVQGYFWGPAAINAPGGPQRPATGLYAI